MNLAPVSGVASAERLRALYGVSLADPNLLILLRHRALLFGIVGGLLLAAAFHLPLRPVALAAGLVSMLSFVVLAHAVGGFNAELARVVRIDVGASLLLAVAGLISCYAGAGAR